MNRLFYFSKTALMLFVFISAYSLTSAFYFSPDAGSGDCKKKGRKKQYNSTLCSDWDHACTDVSPNWHCEYEINGNDECKCVITVPPGNPD